jgi:proline iminopeptidase
MRLAVFFAPLLLAACSSSGMMAQTPRAEAFQVQTAPGVTLYVVKYGAGPNVVIAPGRLFIENEFRDLARPDRTLVLYDMRNRGASSRVEDESQINIAEDVRDLEALRRHLGAPRASLIGYSYLGLMVALYATEHPDRVERLVQIGPVPRVFADYPRNDRANAETLSDEGRAALEAWLVARDAATSETDQRALCEIEAGFSSFWLVGDPGKAGMVANTCRYENEWPANLQRHFGLHFRDLQARTFPVEPFASLAAPVLTIHGTRDRNAPYGGGRDWARTFPSGRLITVEGGAHNVWLDEPSVIADIDRFLRGEWPASAEAVAD